MNITHSSRLIESARTPKGVERAQQTVTQRELEVPSIANQPARVEFSDVLAEAVDAVRGAYKEAGDAATDALLGRGTPHQAMIAGAKAGVAFRFVTQTRHKLVEAYRELMSLQI